MCNASWEAEFKHGSGSVEYWPEAAEGHCGAGDEGGDVAGVEVLKHCGGVFVVGCFWLFLVMCCCR